MGLLDNHCPPPHSTPRMWLRLHLSGFGLIGRKDSALSIIHWIVACTVVCGLAARAWSVYPFEPLAQGWELLRLDFWQRERWISRCFEDWDVFQRGQKTREAKPRMCSHYIYSMQHFMIIFLYQPLQQPPNHYKCPQMPSVKIGWQSWGCVTFFQKYTAQLRAKEAGSGMQGLWWSSLGPQ